MAIQPLYRSGTRSNATARRLIAASTVPAPHVLTSTLEVDMSGRQVRGAVATESMQVGNLHIEVGQHMFFIASKFEGRAYVVTDQGECSSPDERVAAMCRAKVQGSLKQAA